MKNGRAPLNSYGQGDIHNFVNYGIKAGATYKINGHHYLYANVLWQTKAPYARYAYISPRIKDNTADLTSEKVFSADINYVLKTPVVQGRLTLFQSMFFDGMTSTSFYHDEYRTFVNYTETGVDKVYQGIELGVDVKIIPSLSASLVASIGNYRYTSRPTATVSPENGSFQDYKYTVYQKNFYVSGSPQIAGSLSLNYQAPYSIYLSATLNYVDKMYLSFNPERRTDLAVSGLLPTDPLVSQILNQEKLKGGCTLDLSIGKSFRIKRVCVLNLNVGVTNVTNNRKLITGGYEQNRFDFANHDVDKFPPRYFYAFGTTFFINASIRF
ncbi:MAG: TonB-dependent receptor, partial [Bacteroidales bacterium]